MLGSDAVNQPCPCATVTIQGGIPTNVSGQVRASDRLVDGSLQRGKQLWSVHGPTVWTIRF